MKTKTLTRDVPGLCVAIAAFASILTASLALADPPPGMSEIPRGTSETRVVKYADLDLTRRADVLELYQRIEGTSKRVCTPMGDVVPDDACLRDALERTVAKIGLPALTSIYAAKTHQTESPLTVAKRLTAE
jgi:UrcA family protein